jgi:hypothetical protein
LRPFVTSGVIGSGGKGHRFAAAVLLAVRQSHGSSTRHGTTVGARQTDSGSDGGSCSAARIDDADYRSRRINRGSATRAAVLGDDDVDGWLGATPSARLLVRPPPARWWRGPGSWRTTWERCGRQRRSGRAQAPSGTMLCDQMRLVHGNPWMSSSGTPPSPRRRTAR